MRKFSKILESQIEEEDIRYYFDSIEENKSIKISYNDGFMYKIFDTLYFEPIETMQDVMDKHLHSGSLIMFEGYSINIILDSQPKRVYKRYSLKDAYSGTDLLDILTEVKEIYSRLVKSNKFKDFQICYSIKGVEIDVFLFGPRGKNIKDILI